MEWILSITNEWAHYRMRNLLITKQYIFSFALFLAISGIGIWHFQSYVYPQFLTASDTRIFTYFNLKIIPVKLVDQLYSQGEDVFAFGEKVYYLGGLNEKHINSLRRDMIEKGGVETDDNVCLIKKRHNILGEFKLYRSKAPYQVIVSYKEIK